MTRQSFLKCLLGIAASPKIVSEIDFEPPLISRVGPTTTLFSQLNFMIPDYLPKLIEKYGNTSWMEESRFRFWPQTVQEVIRAEDAEFEITQPKP